LPVIKLDITKTNFMLKMLFKDNQSCKSKIVTISKKSSLVIRGCGVNYFGVLPYPCILSQRPLNKSATFYDVMT
jgi:hypothetical protein